MRLLRPAAIAMVLFTGAAARPEPAAHFITNHAVVIGELNPLPQSLIDKVRGHKVVVVGETPGTIEIPAFTAGLLKGLAAVNERVLLAVDLPRANQKPVEKFVRSGDMKEIRAWPAMKSDKADGTTSTAMIDLLIKTRTITNTGILCFAPDNAKDEAERESKMIKYLNQQIDRLKPSVTIVLASISRAKALADRLKTRELLAIKTNIHSGEAWYCLKDCKAQKLNVSKDVYATATPVQRYFLIEETPSSGFGATLFLKETKASAPYLVTAESSK